MMWLILAVALAQPPDQDPVERALAVLAKDPPVEAVQKAALDYFKVDSSDVSGYRTAARLKALLPALTGSYTYDDSNDLRLSTDRFQIQEPFDPNNPQVTDSANGVGRAYSASATWTLSPLVFDPSELEAYALVG